MTCLFLRNCDLGTYKFFGKCWWNWHQIAVIVLWQKGSQNIFHHLMISLSWYLFQQPFNMMNIQMKATLLDIQDLAFYIKLVIKIIVENDPSWDLLYLIFSVATFSLPKISADYRSTAFAHLVSISPSFYKRKLCSQIPKMQKRHWQLDCLFALLGSAGVKVACKHAGKIDPRFRSLCRLHKFVSPDLATAPWLSPLNGKSHLSSYDHDLTWQISNWPENSFFDSIN